MRCLYEKGRCIHCGNTDLSKGEACGFEFASGEGAIALAVSGTEGVGTELKKLLAAFGITATPDCPCNARAAEMDARGPDWCEANIDMIVGWLREQAAERGLPFLDAAGRLLVRRAIRNARQNAPRAASDGMPGPRPDGLHDRVEDFRLAGLGIGSPPAPPEEGGAEGRMNLTP